MPCACRAFARDDSEEPNPPTAEHVQSVYRLVPSKHRLALLFLDWSGARVSAIDRTLVGDYDEARRRVRLRKQATKTRKALWVDLHPVLADALEASLGRARTATPRRAWSPSRAPTRCERRSRRPAARGRSRSSRRTTSATDASRCSTCAASRGRGSASGSASATSR
jgi:hypothetical protein